MKRMQTLDLFPITTRADSQTGALTIAGHKLSELVRQFGSPLYVYDAETIRALATGLNQQLKSTYPGQGMVAYAAKAYFSTRFAHHLAGFGLGADVVSLSELFTARKAGFDAGKVHLHGNNKSASELKTAINWGVQSIVVDSLEELAYVEELAAEYNVTQVRVWLRVTPGLDVHTHPYRQTGHTSSKFGLPVADGQAAEAIRKALSSRRLRLTGLHTHLGSQLFEVEPYQRAMRGLCQLAHENSYIPEEISPGGGWGVPYQPGDESAPISQWVDAVSQSLVSCCQEYGWPFPRLVLEPGRWLSARAGVAIYTLGTHKVLAEGEHVAAVDGGMADNPRPALYQAQYTACLVDRPFEKPSHTWRLVGKFCESGDYLIQDLPLPDFKRGDLLAMPVAGAYQLSMSSNYNLAPRPAVLWLENGTVDLLQQREDPSELNWWNG